MAEEHTVPIERAGSDEEEKQGLLGRILSNPFVMGAGMAATFGANPLAGLLVAPHIIKGGRKLAQFGNEERRHQLQQRQRAEIARDRLPGLLGGQQGQLAQSLLDIGQGGIGGPTMATGLLNATMPTQRSNTTQNKIDALMAEARRRGLNPEQTNAFIDANMNSGVNSNDAIMDMLAIQLAQQNVSEGESEQEARAAAKLDRANSAGNAVSNLIRIVDINDQLSNLPGNTFEEAMFAPGSVIPEGMQTLGARGLALTGDDTAATAKDLMDEFDTISPQLVFDRIEGGVSADSQAEFKELSSTKISRDKVGVANDRAGLRLLKAVLLSPDLRPADRRAAQETIRAIEKRLASGGGAPTREEIEAEQKRRLENP